MSSPIRELVEEKPTLFNSEVYSGLKKNCLYFLFGKVGKEILILKPLKDKDGEVNWYKIDLFGTWNSCYNSTSMDAYFDEKDVPDLFELYHIIEIEHEYWDSSSIEETSKRFNNAKIQTVKKMVEYIK